VSGIGYGTRTSATRPPHLWGAYSEYMYLVPEVSTHHVPTNISAEAAVVAVSSLANGIRWCRSLGGATIAKPVVIQGVGPQGLTSVIAAKESGAFPIIVTGLTSDRPRLDLARELGADICVDVQTEDLVEVVRRATDGAMAPTVVDVSGAAQAIATSVSLVAPHGIIVGGGLVPQGQTVPMNTNEMARKEVRYQGAWTHGYEDSHQALLVAEKGKYPLDKIISHQYTLDEADLALRVMGREVEGVNPIKVAIRP
jgi:alcohol dehydrogenase